MDWPVSRRRCFAWVLGAVAVSGTVGGCVSGSRDLARGGQVKVQAASSAQYRLDPPSVRVEQGALVVSGRAHRLPGAATQPAARAGAPTYFGIWILYPADQIWQRFVVAPSPVRGAGGDASEQEYAIRYFEVPPAGALVMVGQMDENFALVTSGGGGGAGGAAGGPGMVGYNTPGGAVYNQVFQAQYSISQQANYSHTTGFSRALGGRSPGYSGQSGRR